MAEIIGTSGDDNLGGTAGNDIIIGGAGNDLIVGLDGDDVLAGDAGNDTLLAGPGDDVLVGIGGRDVLHGGLGFDLASFADTGATMVAVNLIDGQAADNAGGSFTLIDIEGAVGTNGGDVLLGNSGKNFFFGRGGNDIIEGKEGVDFAAYQSFRAAYSISNSGISKLVSDLVPGRDGADLVLIFTQN